MTMNHLQQTLHERLIASGENVKENATSQQIDIKILKSLSNWEARLELAVKPRPLDPISHLKYSHKEAHLLLENLSDHNPTIEVPVGDNGYTFTPRKVLRRVLDHILDHLNQIDQWLNWQHNRVAPVPTDGWVGSNITFSEDQNTLSREELQAWLWRIDIAMDLLIQKGSQLSPHELNWVPSQNSWSLNLVLHHVASAEEFYVAWLDDPLPQNPILHFSEANRRLVENLLPSLADGLNKGVGFFGGGIRGWTPKAVAKQIVLKEQELIQSIEK